MPFRRSPDLLIWPIYGPDETSENRLAGPTENQMIGVEIQSLGRWRYAPHWEHKFEELMKDQINKLLARSAPLKAKEIARELGFDKTEVSAFLHDHPTRYQQDNTFRWSLAEDGELELTLPDGWVTADDFETALRMTGAVLDGPSSTVRISFPPTCKPMIDCTARLLALVNQLAHRKKVVTVDITNAKSTSTYLNRAGFFDLLHDNVIVLPNRPIRSAARRFQGQSDNMVEFGAVDPDPEADNTKLIVQLTNKFVQQSSPAHKVAAFTVFSEMINNVSQHSQASLHGFAALQKYSGKHDHIQTVVTDSGVGIADTLRPALKDHYSELFEQFGTKSPASDIGLVIAAMGKGEISRFGEGRGLGFKSSREHAVKFHAILSVRQEEFCLRFEYRNGQFAVVQKQSRLPKLQGTHICFDFYVDRA
jgi:hypothetical protein